MDEHFGYVLKDHPAANTRSVSTTSGWIPARIPGRPAGPVGQPPEATNKAFSRLPLNRRDHRTPVTLSVRFRGGPEAWFEIKGRGRTWRVPGHDAFYDVMARIFNGDTHYQDGEDR